MNTAMIVLVLLTGGSWLMARAKSDQSPNDKQGQITVQGCVSRSSGDYVLMQFDPGNSYVMHTANPDIKLGHYLGKEVRVTGIESPTLSDTSDTGRSAPPTTIMANSISTISKECRP
jgi:hypothetical protein